MYLFSALALGFFGSLHCIGMCGPISLAFSGGRTKSSFWVGRIFYNLGRTVTYMLLGMLIGTFGHSLMLAGIQQSLSIVLGVSWLVLLLFMPNWENSLLKNSLLKKLILRVKKQLSLLLKKDRLPIMFNAGLINGVLPCGLVYLALSGALASGDIFDSIAFMGLFGLGTFPAMLGISLLSKARGSILTHIKPLLYGVSLVFALLLIFRGLDLGIPYLSPELVPVEGQAATCN